MGQKVNPHGLRVGINKEWDSKWFPSNKKEWKTWLIEDHKVREIIEPLRRQNSIAKVQIEKTSREFRIIIQTARPGQVLGQDGKNITALTQKINRIVKDKNVEVIVSEVKNPEMNAQLMAYDIANQLERRLSFRIAQKRVISAAKRAGAQGIKTRVSGRLGGVDMARSEGYTEGSVPLHTLRSDIDYGTAEAHTTYGCLGVKVWVYHGEILNNKNKEKEEKDRSFGFENPTNFRNKRNAGTMGYKGNKSN